MTKAINKWTRLVSDNQVGITHENWFQVEMYSTFCVIFIIRLVLCIGGAVVSAEFMPSWF